MSPAAVEIRSPIDNLSSLQNTNPNFTSSAPNSGHSQDRHSMDPSSSSSSSGPGNGAAFGFDATCGSQTRSIATGRVRPRLVKRKHLLCGRARGVASGIGPGFNPVASSGTLSNCTSGSLSSNEFCFGSSGKNEVNKGSGVLNGQAGFVFGSNESDCAVNLNSAGRGFSSKDERIDKKDSNSSSFAFGDNQNNVSFDAMNNSGFGSEIRKGHSVCDNQGMQSGSGLHNVPDATNSDVNVNVSWKEGVFVFGSSGKNTSCSNECMPPKSSNEMKEDFINQNGIAKTRYGCHGDHIATKSGPDPISKLPDEMKKLNINDSGNVHGNGSAAKSGQGGNVAAFVFTSCQNVNMQQNEAATLSSSFSSTTHSFQQRDSVVDEQTKNSSTSTADGRGVSFTEFKAPEWDPASLKENLFPEVSKKPEFFQRSRLSKDKRSKKVKEKSEQFSYDKQNLRQDHAPAESDSQEKLNSPGNYSPMDFSPYEDDLTAGKLPTETPVTSGKPSCQTDHASGCSSSNVEIASAGDKYAFGTEDQESNRTQWFPLASSLENDKAFTFSASSSTQGNLSLRKRQTQTKTRKKVNNSSLRKHPSATTFSSSNTAEVQKEETPQVKPGNKSEKSVEVKEESSSASVPVACEMWRLRGNQAYRNGDLHKAEDCYTHGINSVLPSDNSVCYVKPLALCYSNRAATRISLGRLREALRDCEMAAEMDPNFLKVFIRAANCHLVLGEVEEAQQYLNRCLESDSNVCLDRRTTIEAAEGLQKAQRGAKLINNATELLEKKTSDAALSALSVITEALSISSCSEKLLQMKAEALFMVRRYKEVIDLCEHTLHIPEKNSASTGSVDCLTKEDDSGSENQSRARLWRWHMISKSHFYTGKLDVALDLLQKLQQLGSIIDKHENRILESSNSLAATISELLRCKNAGNEAIRAGRYSEAVELYTTALSRNVESRPFAAICFCNRAAANQALGQIADSIADCSLAMAVDENYTKAVSRRATLHEMIRDYAQAASDLQRLISILEKQSGEKVRTWDTSGGRGSSTKELRQARQRLSVMEEEAKRATPLDFYLILGVKTSDSAADIKKSYRKAALKHHPDKAGQFLVRSDSRDEGRLWKEIVEEVHKDADRLFKMIGEAYAVLSDTTKRSEYDLDEEMRKARATRESSRSSRGGKPSDVNSYPFERSPNRRNWRENRKTNGSSHYW